MPTINGIISAAVAGFVMGGLVLPMASGLYARVDKNDQTVIERGLQAGA